MKESSGATTWGSNSLFFSLEKCYGEPRRGYAGASHESDCSMETEEGCFIDFDARVEKPLGG